MKTIFLKLGLALVAILAFSFGNAQTTDASDGVAQGDAAGPSIRLIDNKGTIKYLQSNNGITTLTSTEAGNTTTTTYQLGGTLTENTYIDVDGSVFVLNGLELVTDITTASTNVDADLNESDNDDDAAAGSTGFTVLIRDEDTGAFQKIRVSDLLQVQAGQLVATATADGIAPALSDTSIPAAFQKVSVYRNGAKLVANLDYTVAAGAVTLAPQTTDPTDWAIISGDVFEVHWVR